ncbi:MAG TPA: hypothetical protein VFS05_13675 [Gemmatimonadaceae bacterium]|nr:hypothetical protein [Gemmatimonadaceae bacterium]
MAKKRQDRGGHARRDDAKRDDESRGEASRGERAAGESAPRRNPAIEPPGAGLPVDEKLYIAKRDETFDPLGEEAPTDGRVEFMRRRQGGKGGDSGMRE